MPAIGNVNVKVSASTGGLVKGMATAATSVRGLGAQLKGFGASGLNALSGGVKGAVSSISRLGSSLLGLAAKFGPLAIAITGVAGAAGLGLMVSSSLEALDANAKLARSLGVSQEELTGFQHAADLSGVSSDKLQDALKKLTRKGISLDVLADKMAAIQDPTERAKLAFDVLGKSGQDLIPLLAEGGDKIRAMAADGANLKGVFSDQDIANVEAANDAVTRTKAAFVGVANSIAVAVAPGLQFVADKATMVGVWLRDAFESVVPIVNATGAVIMAAWNSVASVTESVFAYVGSFVGITFDNIGTAAFDTVMNTLGFFYNLGDNLKTLWGWLGDNWGNLFNDMLSIVGVFASNMLSNFGTLWNAQFRLLTAFNGWVVGLFKNLFSFEVVDAVLTGLIIVGEKIREWASAAWDTVKSIFSGSAPSDALDNFVKTAKTDFQAGMSTLDFGATASGIIKEEVGKLKGPLDGFVSTLTELPPLKTDIPGITSPLTEPLKIPAKLNIAPGDDPTVIKKLDELKGPQAVQRGSSDAVSAIFKAMRGDPQDKMLKTTEAQLREQTKATKALTKIAAQPPIELVAGTI